MKKIQILTTIAALGLGMSAAMASAGSLNAAAPDPVPVQAAPAPSLVSYGADWTGAYVGGSLGYGAPQGSATLGADLSGMTYGVHAGYMQDLGSIVLGGEAQYDMANISDAATGTDIESTTRLKLRAGYDAGAFLPYVTAGWAQMTTSGGIAGSGDGLTYGAGVDYQMTDRLRLGAEVLRDSYDNFAASGEDIDTTSVGLRASFSF